MSIYIPVLQEYKADIDILSSHDFNLYAAKSVSSLGGKPTFNVVYSSKALRPEMSIPWIMQYGLNWITEIPVPSAAVQYSGSWQACSIGQSFDLDKAGYWVVSNKNLNADKQSLNVGSNEYTAVNIVVGVQDRDTKRWAPLGHPPKTPYRWLQLTDDLDLGR